MKYKPFPFIVGCGRSGTTLLASMLGSHPDFMVPGETGFLLKFAKAVKNIDQNDWYAIADLLKTYERYCAWNLDDAILVNGFKSLNEFNPSVIIRELYRTIAAKAGKARFADKTPDHLFVMNELTGLLNEAIFIHLIRDGRDTALALRDTSWGPTDIGKCAHYWRNRVNFAKKVGLKLGSERYFEVKYEELVSTPWDTLVRICNFIGVDPDMSMLDFGNAAKVQFEMSRDPVSDSSLLKPLSKDLRNWSEAMTDYEIATFELIAGDTLSKCGYNLSNLKSADLFRLENTKIPRHIIGKCNELYDVALSRRAMLS